MPFLLPILLFILGLIAIVAGVALISLPVALIVDGSLVLVISLVIGFFAFVGAVKKGGEPQKSN